ncbi:MAG: hypothetical protein DSZ03_01735 [Sulfurimonas sp.]|nr:MAG: hypothetical protein DSZ03_01735 [Sulfurimonas sp.]
MSEPRLQDIEDYNTLKGEKRRVVWAVIVAGLVIGAIYVGAKAMFSDTEDAIPINDTITEITTK